MFNEHFPLASFLLLPVPAAYSSILLETVGIAPWGTRLPFVEMISLSSALKEESEVDVLPGELRSGLLFLESSVTFISSSIPQNFIDWVNEAKELASIQPPVPRSRRSFDKLVGGKYE